MGTHNRRKTDARIKLSTQADAAHKTNYMLGRSRKIAEAISQTEAAEKLDVSERCEMTDRINLIMLEIERIVQAKLDDGQTVENLEKDFDKLVLECLPALTASNQLVGKVRESHTVFSHSINQERTFIHHKTERCNNARTETTVETRRYRTFRSAKGIRQTENGRH